MVLITRTRPVHEAAAGSVTVHAEPVLLLMRNVSVSPTVKSAVLITGAVTDSAPVVVIAPVTVNVWRVAFPLLIVTLSCAMPV
jgi:hypothetical protein